LENQVYKTIRKYGMLSPSDHVVVAVSGGADSIALLLCLHKLTPRLHLSLTVAHLNHRIRGPEADADEDFVRRLSAGLGLPFVSESVDVKQQASESKQNLEELARRRRYDFLRRVASRLDAQKIATGHTLNDQAETVLFRFLRGSGIEGLAAIHPVVDGRIIRPMLECSRERIVEFLKKQGVLYRQDSTNQDLRYSRNRIRRELIPYLEKDFNPRLVRTLALEAGLARETWALLESEAAGCFEALRRPVDEGISLEINGLLRLHPAMRKLVLRHALKQCTGSLRGVASSHIESILALCRLERGGCRVRMPRGNLAIRQFDKLLLLKREPASSPAFSYELTLPGSCAIAEAEAVFRATICSTPDLQTIKEMGPNRVFLEQKLLPPVLTIRSRAPGDRYGGSGHRKVKKMLIDRKIPLAKRSALPMVTAGKDVVWIPGFRPARAFAARPGSDQCVMIEIKKDAGCGTHDTGGDG
jgi:tRNA(Ile)-lysidine synthase